jgi:hypothetical protein
MYHQSLKERITEYFYKWKLYNPDKWIHKGEIEELCKNAGYLGDCGTRRIRELVKDGILEHRPKGKSQEFRYNW